jgi:soluble lytic murein transglycosylase-like protein
LKIVPLAGPWLMALAALGLVALVALMCRLIISRAQLEAQTSTGSATATSTYAGRDGISYAPNVGAPQQPFALPTAIPPVPAALTYEEMFQEIARQHNLDWRLLAELAYQESRMNPGAIGRDNDMGLMQVIPSTWEVWAPKVGVSDPFDPYSNARVGAAFLAYMRDYCQAYGYIEPQWMLVGYNWGPDNLRRLFLQQSGWAQVPARQRRYALEILEATYNRSERWRKNPAQN